ncbi:MAG: cell division protein FtsQ/DivIB [Azospirillaceae bacterium]|nr:cell division protein FtsQ/DivIB [Azospirillaceae bacterium]
MSRVAGRTEDLRAYAAESARDATRRATARANRRRAWPVWTATAIKGTIIAVILAGGVGTLALLSRSDWLHRTESNLLWSFWAATTRVGFKVSDVQVVGRVETERDAIMAALTVSRDDPILQFSPEAARIELERLPWVASARVERRLPATIYVQLVERQPLALWQKDNKLYLIDRDGKMLTDRDLGRYSDLPILVGADAPQQAPELLATLARFPAIARRVEAAIRIGGRRWDLRINNGVEIRLPEANIGAALQHLADAQAKTPLLDDDIVAIDLRLPDRMAIQTSAAAAEKRRAAERKT